MPEKIYNIGEAAAYLGLSRATVRRAIDEGRVRAYRLTAKTVRIDKADLDAWIASCSTKPAAQAA